jgi:hypothetical protein
LKAVTAGDSISGCIPAARPIRDTMKTTKAAAAKASDHLPAFDFGMIIIFISRFFHDIQ